MAFRILPSLILGLSFLTVSSPAAQTVRLSIPKGYLPGVPVLVRVELHNGGGPERRVWDTFAMLSADDPGVTLSTNRILLRNGIGSELVAFRGGVDFALTAAVGSNSFSSLLVSLTNAPVTTIGGTLAGSNVWSGVVRVTNDVIVPAGASLTILSNSLVLIDGVTSGTTANDLLISGRFESAGTEDYPVTITCNSTNLNARWGQIRHNTSQASVYRWTGINRAGRGTAEGHTGTCPVIRSTNSRLNFENCSLTDFALQTRGVTGFGTPGKVAQSSGSDLTFVNCLFQRARMGPEIAGTALACTNTWIMDMRGPDDADGIYLHDQSSGQLVTLSGCVLASGDDDGIDTLGSSITVENCVLRGWDSLFEDAKAISVFNGSTTVSRTLIVDSTVGIAAKWSSGAPTVVNIDHSTLTRNLTNVWANRKDNAPGPFIDFRITNSVLWGGDSIQSDFGATNFTIGYCSISEPWAGLGNINADPMFRDSAAHDFDLLPFSPGIDTGSPSWPLDPDGSGTDMGYLTFTPPAPRFESMQQKGDTIELVLNAYSNRYYRVEFAAGLPGAWSTLATNFQTNAVSVITDSNPAAPRFYRARWQ